VLQVTTTGMLQSAAALVNPLIARAVEVLHVQLHFRCPLNCGYVTWLNCVYPSACLKLQRRPIVDQQGNQSACIHIVWYSEAAIEITPPKLKQPFHFAVYNLYKSLQNMQVV